MFCRQTEIMSRIQVHRVDTVEACLHEVHSNLALLINFSYLFWSHFNTACSILVKCFYMNLSLANTCSCKYNSDISVYCRTRDYSNFPAKVLSSLQRESVFSCSTLILNNFLYYVAGCNSSWGRVRSPEANDRETRQGVPLYPGSLPERGSLMSGEQPIGARVRPHIRGENSGGCVSVDVLLWKKYTLRLRY